MNATYIMRAKALVLLLPVESIIFLLGLAVAGVFGAFASVVFSELFAVTTILVVLAVGRSFVVGQRFASAGAEGARLRASLARLHAGMEPWSSQMRLMLISGQPVPPLPKVTKGTALYGALILEETGETMCATALALAQSACSDVRINGIARVAPVFEQLGQALQIEAGHLREQIAQVPDSEWDQVFPINASVAGELLDGYTDLHVVTAGASLSTGLPGAEAYAEVAASNLSKANPKTGRIDKDPSGKWIKGSAYQPPDLGRILRTKCYPGEVEGGQDPLI